MSRRQRRTRQLSLRQKVNQKKVARRRARLTGARPAAVAMSAVALTVTGVGAAPAEVRGTAPADAVSLKACGDPRTPSSDPSGMVALGEWLFFTANDGVRGHALWKSDGTESGTVLVKDVDRGRGDDYDYGPSQLTRVGDRLFFTADDGVHGEELWVSDGTRRGTMMVEDLRAGARGSRSVALTATAGSLFFSARDGVHGRALWRSDGTAKGTVMVKDVPVYVDDYRTSMTAVNDTLFFVSGNREGRGLWRSDGTEAGTVRVKDVDPVSEYEGLEWVSAGDLLFFAGDDGTHGKELWRSDGTTEGTVMVEDLRPGTYDSDIRDLTTVGDGLFFTARDGAHGEELWRSDGTEAGTSLVEDISVDARDAGPSQLTAVADRLFFFVGADSGDEALWRSDGTEEGTEHVKEINSSDEYGYGPQDLTDVDGTLFFSADDGVHGHALWRSDGTEAGTVLVKDINPDTGEYGYSYGPSLLTDVNGTLFFSGDDGVRGEELWISDGTEAGTVLVSDINKGGAFTFGSRPTANTRNGSLRVRVFTGGAGTLEWSPTRGALVKESDKRVRDPGSTTVTVRPTSAGMRRLERALREARRDGRKVGKVEITTRFTFTPCGGDPSSVTRRLVLKLR